jgi:hypothetical protein
VASVQHAAPAPPQALGGGELELGSLHAVSARAATTADHVETLGIGFSGARVGRAFTTRERIAPPLSMWFWGGAMGATSFRNGAGAALVLIALQGLFLLSLEMGSLWRRSVIFGSECPSSRCTETSAAPDMSSTLAYVCRQTCV